MLDDLKSFTHRMKLHFEFILARYMLVYGAVAFIASIINAYLVIPSILEQIVISSIRTPYSTVISSTASSVGFSLNLAHLVFSIVSLSLAASMAKELSSTSLFHLSQPLKRSEYATSWLFAITWFPSLLMALSLFVPISCFDPRLLLRVGFQPMYLRLVEDILTFSIFCWAALSRRQGIVAFVGLFFILIFPYLSLVIISLIFYAIRATNPPNFLLTMYQVIFPSTASSLFQGLTGSSAINPMTASYGTLVISAIIQLAYLLYFTGRFEVK